ncbi:MAG: geranylgeranylglyceryl/heptaprenylglyceryl phosphate synthase [Saprospiraceae bacterium]
MTFYKRIQNNASRGIKSLSVLIDPDGIKSNNLGLITDLVNVHDIDFFLVGGSLLLEDKMDTTIRFLKKNSDKPVVLFPGNEIQLHDAADAILFLSLISGRNAEYLISKHVVAAPKIRTMDIEVVPTGYMLIHGQRQSTASYISATLPIPDDKPEIAAATALAGQYLGHQLLYLEGGSGATRPISNKTIKAVRQAVNVPIIVGGGIKNANQMQDIYISGADIQVIGTAIERKPELLEEFSNVKKHINQQFSTI